jgi:hypothetical protein
MSSYDTPFVRLAAPELDNHVKNGRASPLSFHLIQSTARRPPAFGILLRRCIAESDRLHTTNYSAQLLVLEELTQIAVR